MKTKRRRAIAIEITEPDDDEPPIDRARLDAALWRCEPSLAEYGWLRIDTDDRPPVLRLDAEGPFSAESARRIARVVRDALDNQGHAIIWLSEDYAEGPERSFGWK
jgi:hypothetical protein